VTIGAGQQATLAQVLVDRATDGIVALVEPEHRSLVLRMIASASSEDPVEFLLMGGDRWAEATVSDLRADPAVGGVVLAIRDVTERRRLTDAVTRAYLVEREAAARARALEETRADLLAAVSHDFRTPLTSILGFCQMLRGHWNRFDDETRLDMVARVLCAGEELDRRVADFLDIARLDSALPSLRSEAVVLADVVQAAVDRLQIALDEHDVRVSVDPAVRALVDQTATSRVVENLLTNAAKYAPAGTAVTICARGEGDHVVLTVADEGPGIAAEDRERVFDRFVRLGERSKVRGAGIGLAVVRQLVEAQGGHVSVEPGPNGGSAFVVVLRAPVGTGVRA
jgi:two-component system sensor histidine kinase KdpD